MIQISQLKLPILHTEEELKKKLAKMLRINSDAILSYTIKKRSLDARKKPELFYIYTLHATVTNEAALQKKLKSSQIVFGVQDTHYECYATGVRKLKYRPVVIGTGPAGLFCGYQLAAMGYRPILLERGAPVEERIDDVQKFWEDNRLNPCSNVQFGEGGAGTFSDGKLNTLVKDPQKRGAMVLETFVKCGAPAEILYDNKPHIGTDILITVVKNMRTAILSMGGEIRFHSRVVDFLIREEADREIQSLLVEDAVSGNCYQLDTDIAVAAIGHSARDTFEKLAQRNIPMEAKAFAVGVRIEHPQEIIDQSQYGKAWGGKLPAAAYKLTANASDGRGVYTFCMCPGGYVVNASSEEGHLAVNGMSYHDRAGSNANSAVIVTVYPDDYGSTDALSGVRFQRELEAKAFQEGQGAVPVQLYEDFKSNCASVQLKEVIPQIKGAYRLANIRNIFPEYINNALAEGIALFGKKLRGFDRGDAVIAAVESRTSSPVRILRDEKLQSQVGGLYPCGEGAGYAGGITSAAMDGLKVAEEIAKLYQSFDNGWTRLRNF